MVKPPPRFPLPPFDRASPCLRTPSPPASCSSIDSHVLVETWLNFQTGYSSPPIGPTDYPLLSDDGQLSRSRILGPTHSQTSYAKRDGSPSRQCYFSSGQESGANEWVGGGSEAPEASRLPVPGQSWSGITPAGSSGSVQLSEYAQEYCQDSSQIGQDTNPRSGVDSASQSEHGTPGLYGNALSSTTMPPPSKRKSESLSPSKASSSLSDIRRKRQALSFAEPSGTFGIPDLADLCPDDPRRLPPDVRSFLKRFSTGRFEVGCVPTTPEIDKLLVALFDHEDIPAHSRSVVNRASDTKQALTLFNFAHEIHRGCLRNSRRALDEASWYPFVRGLLSVEPPSVGSSVPIAPSSYDPVPTVYNFFLTVDATTKSTLSALPPTNLTVKVDAVIALNPDHAFIKPSIRRALRAGIKLNAFNDISLAGSIIALAVEVKPSGGGGGEMEAEYQLGVYGMKTLGLMRYNRKANFVPSVSVCGHTWNLHVTYETGDEVITHGPVTIGATDTFYGTMKIVSFVCAIKEWARTEMWEAWAEGLQEVVA